MDARGFYDDLSGDYDLMVSWEQRLAREGAFFGSLFRDDGARRILDTACGTGMHAIAFCREGREVIGTDLSPAMVEKARANARAAGVTARFETAGFGGIAARVGTGFDAVTCVGNSLPHVGDDASLAACLDDFCRVLRPGGTLVIQNRNYDRLLTERQRFMPPASRVDAGGETLFLRMTDYPLPGAPDEEAVTFTLVVLKKRDGAWSMREASTPLRAIRRSTLEAALLRSGFSSVRAFGSYAREEYDPARSSDLIVVARRDPALS